MKSLIKPLAILIFCLPVLHPSGLLAQTTDVDRQLYEIYRTSYSEELADEQWLQQIKGLSQRSYVVTAGDTLWDLSLVFFGDGFFWPKIWSFNENLTNPHLLRVGQQIEFFTGSVEQAPGVVVAGKSTNPNGAGLTEVTANDPAEANDTLPSDPSALNSAIPESRKRVPPVVTELPNTFTDSKTYDSSSYGETGVSYDIRPPVQADSPFVAQSFLYGQGWDKYPKVGRIVESENHLNLIGVNHRVYIKSSESLKVGERLTIMGRQYHFDRNDYVGDVIRYLGTVEISSVLEDQLFMGTVISSLSGIRNGAWVSREAIPELAADYSGRPFDKVLKIIGGGMDNVSRIYGQGNVVFLGGGAKSGVRAGDVFGVYQSRDLRYQDYKVRRSPEPIGYLKVFRADPEISSAVIVSSTDVIVPGDETGAPQWGASASNPSAVQNLESFESEFDLSDDEFSSDLDEFESEIQ